MRCISHVQNKHWSQNYQAELLMFSHEANKSLGTLVMMLEASSTSSSSSQSGFQHPTPVLLPGKSHGRRSLVGCSPWRREESDTTERLHSPFSLSCIGEGNGNPLQCSCLENPRDGGAW